MARHEKLNWISLLVGIILVAGSIFVFRKPAETFLTLSSILGIVAMVRGIILLANYYRNKDLTTFKAKFNLSLGVLLTIIGIVLLFRPAFAAYVFAYTVAIWFIADSARNLVRSNLLKIVDSRFYMFHIVMNMLLLIAGIVLLFNPFIIGVALSLIIGISLLVLGIEYVTFAFFSSQIKY